MFASPVEHPLSYEKIQRIALWAQEVEQHRPYFINPFVMELSMAPIPAHHTHNASYGGGYQNQYAAGSSALNQGVTWALYHQLMDSSFDMDRWTVINDGDKRLASLPNPQTNPLMTADLGLLREEYISVLKQWNEFEVDKWAAERMLRGAATPDNVQRVFAAENAIEAANSAVQYIEMHCAAYGVQCDFGTLFRKYYQGLDFQVQEEDCGWMDIPSYDQHQASFDVGYDWFQPQMVAPQPTFSHQQTASFPPCTPLWPAHSHMHSLVPSRTIQV